MFLKLFFIPLTLYLFVGGYSITFIIMFFTQKLIFQILWIAFIGGISISLLWATCLQIFIVLLNKKELAYIFNIDLSDDTDEEYIDLDTTSDSELTLDELYSSQNTIDNINTSSEPQENNHIIDSSILDSDLDDTFTPYQNATDQEYTLDQDGTFQMTSNGKTFKATPQEGAKAIRKVLHDDTK